MNGRDIASHQEPRVIEAFTSAAISALQELAQLEAIVDESPVLDVIENHDFVSATIRLVRTLPGTLTLILTEESAARLAARYLPIGTALTTEIINDVVGEFANVIAGQAKTILKGTPFHFMLSTPAVARAPLESPPDGVVEESRLASITFDERRLVLFVQLPPCAGA